VIATSTTIIPGAGFHLSLQNREFFNGTVPLHATSLAGGPIHPRGSMAAPRRENSLNILFEWLHRVNLQVIFAESMRL
jgi:hypothetical protein